MWDEVHCAAELLDEGLSKAMDSLPQSMVPRSLEVWQATAKAIVEATEREEGAS